MSIVDLAKEVSAGAKRIYDQFTSEPEVSEELRLPPALDPPEYPERVSDALFRNKGEAAATPVRVLWVSQPPAGATIYEECGLFASEQEYRNFYAWSKQWIPTIAEQLDSQEIYLIPASMLAAKISIFTPDSEYSKAAPRSGQVSTISAPDDRYCLVGFTKGTEISDPDGYMIKPDPSSLEANPYAPRADWPTVEPS